MRDSNYIIYNVEYTMYIYRYIMCLLTMLSIVDEDQKRDARFNDLTKKKNEINVSRVSFDSRWKKRQNRDVRSRKNWSSWKIYDVELASTRVKRNVSGDITPAIDCRRICIYSFLISHKTRHPRGNIVNNRRIKNEFRDERIRRIPSDTAQSTLTFLIVH